MEQKLPFLFKIYNMIYISIVSFCIAGLLGTFIITKVVGGKPISNPLKNIHAVIAFVGLIVITIYMFQIEYVSYYLRYSLGLFIVAGFLGFFALRPYKPEDRRPQIFALLHALTAVGGLMMLFVYWALYL